MYTRINYLFEIGTKKSRKQLNYLKVSSATSTVNAAFTLSNTAAASQQWKPL